MIQQVVVGTDGSQDAQEAVRQAVYIAAKTGSSLKCVFIVDLRKTQLPYMYAGGSYEGAFERLYIPPDPSIREFYAQLSKDLDSFAEKHIAACRSLAEGEGVPFESVVKDLKARGKLLLQRYLCLQLRHADNGHQIVGIAMRVACAELRGARPFYYLAETEVPRQRQSFLVAYSVAQRRRADPSLLSL